MDKVSTQIDLPADAKALADALTAFAAATATALKDGFQLGTDMPAIVSAAFADIVPVIAKIKNVPGDFSEMPVETGYVFAKAGFAIIAAIKAPKA